MKKKILLFSCDPGGANTIIPLINPLLLKGYDVFLYGIKIALKKYEVAKLNFTNLFSVINNFRETDIKEFINKCSFDCVITGTSAEDFTEKYIWNSCKCLKVPSFAILDQWMNYGIRFSNYPVSQIIEYNKNKKLVFLPNKIFVMDEYAKRQMINEGICSSKIVVTGQPHFETIMKSKALVCRDYLKKFLEIKDFDFCILFASEPISQYKNNYFGYTEISVLNSLIKCLKHFSKRFIKRILLVIRPHPKENNDVIFDKVIAKNSNDYLKIIVNKDIDSFSLIDISDLVCGMSSMFLIEASIKNKRILSMQMGLKQEDPFVFAKRNIINTIKTDLELHIFFENFFLNKTKFSITFNFIKKPVNNIVKYIEKAIN